MVSDSLSKGLPHVACQLVRDYVPKAPQHIPPTQTAPPHGARVKICTHGGLFYTENLTAPVIGIRIFLKPGWSHFEILT